MNCVHIVLLGSSALGLVAAAELSSAREALETSNAQTSSSSGNPAANMNTGVMMGVVVAGAIAVIFILLAVISIIHSHRAAKKSTMFVSVPTRSPPPELQEFSGPTGAIPYPGSGNASVALVTHHRDIVAVYAPEPRRTAMEPARVQSYYEACPNFSEQDMTGIGAGGVQSDPNCIRSLLLHASHIPDSESISRWSGFRTSTGEHNSPGPAAYAKSESPTPSGWTAPSHQHHHHSSSTSYLPLEPPPVPEASEKMVGRRQA